jgi:hypothetical protein
MADSITSLQLPTSTVGYGQFVPVVSVSSSRHFDVTIFVVYQRDKLVNFG